MRKHILKKSLIIGIILIFTCSSFASSLSEYSEVIIKENNPVEEFSELQEKVVVSCSTYGLPVKSSREIEMSYFEVEELFERINKLAEEIAYNPSASEIEKLREDIIFDVKAYNLLPKDISLESLKPSSFPQLDMKNPKKGITPIVGNRGTASLCNFVTTGSGMQFPIIILPRLIPILLTPIPRAFLHWSANEGYTSCGSYLTGTGFMAEGMQRGTALGFWGIGFSVFIPPVMAYGFIGYALFATCTAEEIEPWPPNNPPIISDENPPNGVYDVPISPSELSFRIEDKDGDSMDYSVRTFPDVGEADEFNKKDGTYTVPISGLEHSKSYTWAVEVTDGKDTVQREFSFMTEELPFDPFEEGWGYRKKITINHTKVDGNLENFPILVSTIDTCLRDKAQDDGDDILFMDGSGIANKMYHELERYDGGSGEIISWVKIDDLSENEDTVLYMYYGNPSCSSQQLPERMWVPSFMLVQHLSETAGMHYDSTVYDNDGSPKGGLNQNAVGKVDGADKFDGVNDCVQVGNSASLNFGTGDFSFSLWIKQNEQSEDDAQQLLCKRIPKVGNYEAQIDEGQELRVYSGGAILSYMSIQLDKWYHICYVRKSGIGMLYIDANLEDSASAAKNVSTNEDLFFGMDPHHKTPEYFNGIIDEVRISNKAQSQNWISTEYNNQNDPTSFLSFGPEETGP